MLSLYVYTVVHDSDGPRGFAVKRTFTSIDEANREVKQQLMILENQQDVPEGSFDPKVEKDGRLSYDFYSQQDKCRYHIYVEKAVLRMPRQPNAFTKAVADFEIGVGAQESIDDPEICKLIFEALKANGSWGFLREAVMANAEIRQAFINAAVEGENSFRLLNTVLSHPEGRRALADCLLDELDLDWVVRSTMRDCSASAQLVEKLLKRNERDKEMWKDYRGTS